MNEREYLEYVTSYDEEMKNISTKDANMPFDWQHYTLSKEEKEILSKKWRKDKNTKRLWSKKEWQILHNHRNHLRVFQNANHVKKEELMINIIKQNHIDFKPYKKDIIAIMKNNSSIMKAKQIAFYGILLYDYGHITKEKALKFMEYMMHFYGFHITGVDDPNYLSWRGRFLKISEE